MLMIMVIMMILVRFLMKNPKIIVVMEKLVTKTLVTVVMMSCRRNSMEKKSKTKLDLIKKLRLD